MSLLLAFILPVSLAAPISSIPDRLAGWGMASAAALLAVAFLWPSPARNPLRDAAIAACRALALRLRADALYLFGGKARPSTAERDDAIAQANAAVAVLQRVFFATPYRPTGLGTAARTVVRLVDELSWVNAILVQSRPHPAGMPGAGRMCGEGRGGIGARERRGPAGAARWAPRHATNRPGRPGRSRRSDRERPNSRQPLAGDRRIDTLGDQLARPELPCARAGLRRLPDRGEHRPDRGGRAAQLAATDARSAACRPGRDRVGRTRTPPPTSNGTPSGCTTASAAPSALASPFSSRT